MRIRASTHGRGLVVIGLSAVLAGIVAACGGPPAPKDTTARTRPPTAPVAEDLKPVEAFASIADKDARARALFLEASRVLMHARCVNCHPAGDVPAQGDALRAHDPPVVRGPKDEGVVGLECRSCHQDKNVELARVPGAPKWHLAPIEMAWVGKSAAQICEQIKDPKRNGQKTLAQIAEHSAHDELVAWGWSPGHGRGAAPGTRATSGAPVQAWVDAGAGCRDASEAREKSR